jgi:hypothetical protein
MDMGDPGWSVEVGRSARYGRRVAKGRDYSGAAQALQIVRCAAPAAAGLD